MPASKVRPIWASSLPVRNSFDVPVASKVMVSVAEVGFWLAAAKSAGGVTQWYGGGGMKPSNRGRTGRPATCAVTPRATR